MDRCKFHAFLASGYSVGEGPQEHILRPGRFAVDFFYAQINAKPKLPTGSGHQS